MSYTPHVWENNKIPAINETHLNEIEAGIVDAQKQIIPPDHVYYVSPSFTESEEYHKFNKIQSAITYAKANMPAYPDEVVIFVNPGTYEEQITDTHYRIFIVGPASTSYYMKPAILYNTGADAAHYPIAYTGSSKLNLINITVKVDDGGVFGVFQSMRADKCTFRTGYFVEYTGSGDRLMEFRVCIIVGDAFKFTGAVDNRYIALRQCDLYGGTISLASTANVGKSCDIKFERSMCSSNMTVGGDWGIYAWLSEMYGSGVITFDTTAALLFDKVLLPNGIHFTSDPTGSKSMVDCNFVNSSIAASHKDIDADVTITDFIYSGNVQQNGISGKIQIVNSEKNVGEGYDNRYFSIQDAITSVPANTIGIVKIYENIVDLAELTLPAANTEIVIDGQKKYSLTFVADIVEIGADRKLSFTNMANLTGGEILLNGANAEISFEDCQYITGYLTLQVGAFVIIYKSSIFGPTGKNAITINNVDTIMVIGYSRIQGGIGNPAVEFTVDADNKFKVKYSTFIHGDKGSNVPIIGATANDVIISMYACALNAAFSPSDFTNNIGASNNTIDSEITY